MTAPLMTAPEVAAAFRVTERSVRRYAAAGKFLVLRTPGGVARFWRDEVEALLRGEPPEAARKLGEAQRDRLAAEAHRG